MLRRTHISSILVGGTALLLMGGASAREMPAPPTHERTVAAIAACGVPAAQVRITYEDELQSDLVSIGDLGGSDEARFRCLRDAVHPDYILDIFGAPQRDSYYAFQTREYRRTAKVEALAWLEARNKLDAVPHYDPAMGLEKFARALEAACSIRQGSAIEVVGSSGVAFRRSFIEKLTLDVSDAFDCLIHMSAASDAEEHGVGLTLVGNEAYQTGNRN